ncbi:Hypothetical predicted protein, partial [Pelobates cultripes]
MAAEPMPDVLTDEVNFFSEGYFPLLGRHFSFWVKDSGAMAISAQPRGPWVSEALF